MGLPPREKLGSLSGERRSASAEASRQEELERIRQLSPRERVALALRLGRRRQALLERRIPEDPKK